MHNLTLALILAATLLLLGASTSGAVELSFTGPSSATVEAGESFSVDFVMTNLSEDVVAAVLASAYDYAGVATFVTGDAVSNFFNTACPSPGTCLGGLLNSVSTPLVESSIAGHGDRVQFVDAVTITIINNPGAGIDQGLDGQVGTTMFSLMFEAVDSGDILIGTGYEGDTLIIRPDTVTDINPLTFTVNVVPEPGTGLLIGLGLLGLAAHRRQ